MIRRGAIKTASRGDQAIFEVKSAVGFFTAQTPDHIVLGHGRLACRKRRLHRRDHALRSLLEQRKFSGRFARAEPFQRYRGVNQFALGKGRTQHVGGVERKEGHFDADTNAGNIHFPDVRDRRLHRVGTGHPRSLGNRRPEPVQLLLEALEPVADEHRPVGMALGIDKHRQIAVEAYGVHRLEEEEPVSAQKIPDIMLRRRDQDIDARLFEQVVQLFRVEGDCRSEVGRTNIHCSTFSLDDPARRGGLTRGSRALSRMMNSQERLRSGSLVGPARPRSMKQPR